MATKVSESLRDRLARLPADRQALMARLQKSDRSARSNASGAILSRTPGARIPLSYAQQRLWFLAQLGGDEPFYNIDYARRFSFEVNFGVLETAINEIVRRHEALRTTFDEAEGEPLQVIAPALMIPLERIDLSELPAMRRESEAARLAFEEARKPFDLARGPLLRTTLLKLGERDFILLLTLHHIICDAWSMMVLARELVELYPSLLQGRPSPLPELPIQYADWAVWQRRWLESGVLDAQLAYWKQRLARLPSLRLPTDRPRPSIQSYRGGSWYVPFPADLTEAVRQFSQREGVTLFMTLLTAYLVLLRRYSGQDDLVIGAPVANRNRTETQGLIGFFVNTLVLRVDLSGDPTLRELLRRVQASVAEAFANQDVPFESLVEELQPKRDLSRNPLYQVSLQVYQHATGGYGDKKLLKDRVHVDKGTASIDLAFDVFEVPEGLVARIEYSTELFDKSTVERMVGHFQTLLQGMSGNLDTTVAELPMLSAAERRQLLETWNQTRSDYPRDACIHQLFEAQAQRTPDAIAVESAEGRLTYRELDRRANHLASYLQSQGVKPDVLVGICMERSLDMVVGLLGILKAGGAYVPLDPAYPVERLSWLVEDGELPLVVTHKPVRDRLPATLTHLVSIDGRRHQDFSRRVPPHHASATSPNLAYVIYTSGSTGTPNGVMIEHRSACMQLTWMQQACPLKSHDRVVQKYSLSFDAAALELFCPLAVGATVVLAGRDHRVDPAELVKLMIEQRITAIDIVPSLLQAIVEQGSLRECPALRRIVCGGEAMSPELARQVLEQRPIELINMYGPTETTINATFARCDSSDSSDRVMIGRPCGNTEIYVLDERGNPVPVGVPGEIHIGGEGLARGYLNRPNLNARRFINNTFSPERAARLFRTGDRARYHPTGDIEFLGRIDGQVKIGGFRVETGEIEAVAARHHAVRSVHVAACESGSGRSRLVAYVVPRVDEPEIWPSIGEYVVYDELTYYAMTNDEGRNRAYRMAMTGHVKGKTVVDIGTGADALWARYCVAEGARHVYAFEMLDEAYEQARTLVRQRGLEDRITVLHGDSRALSLPERVDVCVSEMIGTIGSSEGTVPILNDAWRFLKPGGAMIPYRCVTKIAAVSLPEKMRDRPGFTALTRAYVDRIFAEAGFDFGLRVCLKNLPDDAIISDAADFETLEFTAPIELQQQSRLSLTINRDATIDGFLLWLNLYPAPDQFIDVISGEHSWLPVFFPVFYPGRDVRRGDRIEACSHVIDNGTLTPDYRIEGRIHAQSGEVSPFDYLSQHRDPSTALTPFFKALLGGPPLPAPRRAALGGKSRQTLIADLRDHLQRTLPDYMVPSSFVLLKALPLTPTGKVDRHGLPDPDHDREQRAEEFVSPRSRTECAMADVWQELLGVSAVGIHDNFFDLGGNSLMIIRLQSRLRQRLGIDVSLTQLFQHPTVAALSAALLPQGTAAADDAHRQSPLIAADS